MGEVLEFQTKATSNIYAREIWEMSPVHVGLFLNIHAADESESVRTCALIYAT